MELLSNASTIIATMKFNDTDTISLYCEMREFIRPDSFLIWEGPGGQIINGGMGKHQITFSNGSVGAAINGGGMLVPSRVSTLTITNPNSSDAGTYTCRVIGTSEVITIELIVNGRTSTRSGILQLIIITILTGLLIITIPAAMYGLYALNKSTSDSNPIYDYIAPPGLDPGHNGRPDEDTATRTDGVVNDVIRVDLTIVERNYDELNDNLDTSAHDTINTTEINVEHGVTVDSEMNAACGLTTDGINNNSEKISATYGVHTDGTDTEVYDHFTTDADMTDKNETEADCVATDGIDTMERNIAYDVADTIMENNEAYGAAIDGIGIDTMERNIAYGAVLNQDQDDSAGDADAMVDDDNK